METDALLDGVVTSWDDPRGLGEITAADGRTFALQCTDLADGSRTTEAGVAVTPGRDFDAALGSRTVRLSFAAGAPAIAEAIERIVAFQDQ